MFSLRIEWAGVRGLLCPDWQGLWAQQEEGTELRDPSSPPHWRALWPHQPRATAHVPPWDPWHHSRTPQTRTMPKTRSALLMGFSSPKDVWHELPICVWTASREIFKYPYQQCVKMTMKVHSLIKNANIWIVLKKNGNVLIFLLKYSLFFGSCYYNPCCLSTNDWLWTGSSSHAETWGRDSLWDDYTTVSSGPAPNHRRKWQCDNVEYQLCKGSNQ